MIEYRTITAADIDAVVGFAIDGMRPHLYPGVLSQAKVRVAVEHFSQQQGFHLCAFDDGKLVGAIAAIVDERLWMERLSAHVVCCRAVVSGVGRRLVQALREWADAQMMIRHVSFALECDVDSRMIKLLQRYGFMRQQIVMHYFKGD